MVASPFKVTAHVDDNYLSIVNTLKGMLLFVVKGYRLQVLGFGFKKIAKKLLLNIVLINPSQNFLLLFGLLVNLQ